MWMNASGSGASLQYAFAPRNTENQNEHRDVPGGAVVV